MQKSSKTNLLKKWFWMASYFKTLENISRRNGQGIIQNELQQSSCFPKRLRNHMAVCHDMTILWLRRYYKSSESHWFNFLTCYIRTGNRLLVDVILYTMFFKTFIYFSVVTFLFYVKKKYYLNIYKLCNVICLPPDVTTMIAFFLFYA